MSLLLIGDSPQTIALGGALMRAGIGAVSVCNDSDQIEFVLGAIAGNLQWIFIEDNGPAGEAHSQLHKRLQTLGYNVPVSRIVSLPAQNSNTVHTLARLYAHHAQQREGLGVPGDVTGPVAALPPGDTKTLSASVFQYHAPCKPG